MNRSLRKHTLCILTFVSLVFAFAVPGMAQTTDTDTAEVSLVVTRSSETPTETVTPSETPTATATATESPTPTPTEVANEDCPSKPDNARRIDPNAFASQQAPLGTPCNPLTNKVAGPVTQLPNTGVGIQDSSVPIGFAILVVTGIILIGSAGAMVKQRS